MVVGGSENGDGDGEGRVWRRILADAMIIRRVATPTYTLPTRSILKPMYTFYVNCMPT
jgi:hypothetical protein